MKIKILSKIFIISSLLCLLASGFSCGGGGSEGPSAGTGTPPPDGKTPPPDGGGGTPQPPTLGSCKDGYCLIPEEKKFQPHSDYIRFLDEENRSDRGRV